MQEQEIKIDKFIENNCVNDLRKDAVSMIVSEFKVEYKDALKEYNRWRKRYMMVN